MKKNSGSKKNNRESKARQPEKNKQMAEKKPLLTIAKENPYITGFFVILGVLLILDFMIHKHETISIGNVPEFYAVYGFVSAAALVFGAKALRALFGQIERR
ncbi:MAG: hypothetical protein WC799_11720 [Desulfobacteraceae bacterium]|jgi:hypothetical protein